MRSRGVRLRLMENRQVLVSILGMADRFDWKACTQPEEEDTEDAQAFKAAFLSFDPSLE